MSERESERRIEQLEALAGIGEIAAGTIHEIRNPLTSIGGFVQLLKARAARQHDQTSVEYCTLISEEIGHINGILSEFLALAKPQEGKFACVNISQIIQDVLSLMYGEAVLSGIAISARLPDEAPSVYGNAEKIKEVLINLCRNAFQAMSAGGRVTITAGAYADAVRVAVSDTGHGIDPAALTEIFKPFFTTKATGTGLGLAICQRIMRDHGGDITVASEEGRGTTFTLVFPLTCPAPETGEKET